MILIDKLSTFFFCKLYNLHKTYYNYKIICKINFDIIDIVI